MHEVRRETPYRHFRLWQKFHDLEMNVPSRTDHYLMSIACEIWRVAVKNPKRIKLKDFRLEFSPGERVKRKKPPIKPEQKKRLVDLAKAVWKLRMGAGKG